MLLWTLLVACVDSKDEAVAYEGDVAGECADGADNDRDGAYDCLDPDCAGAPDCADVGDDSGNIDGDDSGGHDSGGGDSGGGDSGGGDSGGDDSGGGHSGGEDDSGLVPGGRWTGEARLSEGAYRLGGDRREDLTGTSLAVGDVDGDGLADLLVGAPGVDGDEDGAGAAWLVLGAITADRALKDADASLLGVGASAHAGQSVGLAGDLDGDGYADAIVGAPVTISPDTRPNGPGAAYVVLGPLSGELSLGDADAIWTGETHLEGAGRGVLSGSDLTGDGREDVALGAYWRSDGQGAAYVLGEGALDGGSLSDADARIFPFSTGLGQGFGSDVFSLGDLDGDGLEDLGVGWGWYTSSDSSILAAVTVFLGGLSGAIDAADADAMIGGQSGALGGYDGGAHAVGDVDGDGAGDLLLGAPETRSGGYYSGAAYLVSGAEVLDGTNVLFALATIKGDAEDDYLGWAVTGWDIDGDGAGDLVVGDPNDSTYARTGGAICLFYGPVSGSHDCSGADAVWYGDEDDDDVGTALLGGSDLTGDGVADLLVGARGGTGDSEYSGLVYLIPGL